MDATHGTATLGAALIDVSAQIARAWERGVTGEPLAALLTLKAQLLRDKAASNPLPGYDLLLALADQASARAAVARHGGNPFAGSRVETEAAIGGW